MTGSGRGRATTLGVALALILVCSACDWTQFMGNAALNGNDPSETTITAANVSQLAPTYAIALPGTSKVVFSPVTSTGQIFAGTDEGQLVASSTNPTNCSGAPAVCQPSWTASLPGQDTASTPVVSGGLVYETFSRGDGTVPGVLAAYDANGVTNCSGSPKTCQPVWAATVSSIAGVNVDGGTLFVADTPAEQLKAFDAAGVQGCSGSPTRTCQPLWSAAIVSQSVPSIAGGKVYVPTSAQTGAQVSVFDQAGSTNCSGSPKVCQPLFQVALPSGSTGSVDVAGGVGYLATFDVSPSTPNHLVAFDANGATNCSGAPTWCQPLWSAVLSGFAWFTTPAVSGGRVYVASTTAAGGVVDQFDANGVAGCSGTPVVCTRLVTTSAGADYRFGSPVVSNGLVIMKNAIYPATDTSHCSGGVPIVCTPLWSSAVTSPLSGSIISNGTVFLPGTDGAIHAYRVPGT